MSISGGGGGGRHQLPTFDAEFKNAKIQNSHFRGGGGGLTLTLTFDTDTNFFLQGIF